MKTRARIEFEGIVQGVGFRPFLHTLADSMDLVGWALNTSAGVLMELEGAKADIETYVRRVNTGCPPLARVLTSRVRWLPPVGLTGFTIRPSQREEGELTLLCPDVATCPDCVRELNDPDDRRYRYPFVNCTNCGPRYTIVRSLPYDRPSTTMAAFPLCGECRGEYEDVQDRRYHAQPVACEQCGPSLWFETNDLMKQGQDVIETAARFINNGRIIAMKGLGGFHLACRADLDWPVYSLRERKRRSFFKPLAIMVRDIAAARELCEVDDVAEEWLASTVSPVVLLPVKHGVTGKLVSRFVAPRQTRLGVMLPYTPMHHLLLNAVDYPLIMTSGNLSDEPIVSDNDKAREGLGPLVDGLVLHDRPIQARCDDSVLTADARGSYTVFRHSRGFAPFPLAAPSDAPTVLALGGDIKTTFAVNRGRFVFLSPHLGDGEHLATYSFFRDTWEHYQRLFGLRPEAIACDMHPGYFTLGWARELSLEYKVPLVRVQHHHAHLVSLISEYNLKGPQTAIVADGTGYGEDGKLWGGEVLCGDAHGYERAANMLPIKLPGGDEAVREPWRIAMALVHQAAPDWLDSYTEMLLNGKLAESVAIEFPGRIRDDADPQYTLPDKRDVQLVRSMLESDTATVESSALGRLFDGVAALLGLTFRTTYEGQGPMELEAVAGSLEIINREVPAGQGNTIDWRPLIKMILVEIEQKKKWSQMLHLWASEAFFARALQTATTNKQTQILATGGCLQNTLMKKLLSQLCEGHGLKLVTHQDIPPGDGGVALGILNAAIAKLNYI